MPLIKISIINNGEHWEKKISLFGICVYHRHDFMKEPQRKPVGFQVFENSIVEVIDEDYWLDDYKTPKKMNMRIKDLLANREKLARYDELKEWKERFEQPPKSTIDYVHSVMHVEGGVMNFSNDTHKLPENIKQIIVKAIEAEIQKLDEE